MRLSLYFSKSGTLFPNVDSASSVIKKANLMTYDFAYLKKFSASSKESNDRKASSDLPNAE